MRPWWYLALILLTGCSTSPCYDFLDRCKPGHMYKDRVTPYGGVCIPGQGTVPIAAMPAPILPTTPPVTVPVIPGPTPLSGSGTTAPIIVPPPPPPPR